MVLNRTVYYTGTIMDIQIENTTDHAITVEDARAVLKKNDNGEWEYVYKTEIHNPKEIAVGGVYTHQLHITPSQAQSGSITVGSADTPKGITDKPLEAGEYKLLWAVDGRWVSADFTLLQRPVLNAEEDVRTDITLELDNTEIENWREDVISVSIQNTTEQELVVNEVYAILKKGDDGKWRRSYQRSVYQPQTLKPGEVYTYSGDLTAQVDIDLSNYELGVLNFYPKIEYKLAWLVDDTWVLSDTFTVKKR